MRSRPGCAGAWSVVRSNTLNVGRASFMGNPAGAVSLTLISIGSFASYSGCGVNILT